jgi:hypothetical protein
MSRELMIYLGLCLLVGLLGMNRKFGFWAYFFASMALTPLLGIVLVLASDSRRERRGRP